MKAIMIVDIPDDYDEYGSGDWYIIPNDYDDELSIVYEEDDRLMHYKDIDGEQKLKPMPDKIDQGYPCSAYDEGYGDGWDACLDEILGGEQ